MHELHAKYALNYLKSVALTQNVCIFTWYFVQGGAWGGLGKDILTLFTLFSLLGHVFGRACSRQIDTFSSLFTLFSLLAHVSAEACKCITCAFLLLFTLFSLPGADLGRTFWRYLRYSRSLGMSSAEHVVARSIHFCRYVSYHYVFIGDWGEVIDAGDP